MNQDGKSDTFYLDLEFPVKSTEYVHKFQLLLFFEYRLKVCKVICCEMQIILPRYS